MPARGSYQITSREEGKSAQRDESYKSCVLAMLIFFLLCIVIILASWPWKNWHTDRHNRFEKDSKETAKVQGEGFSTVADDREIVMDRTTKGPVKKDSEETANVHGEGFSTVADDREIVLDRTTKGSVKKNEHFERYSINSSTKSHENFDTKTTEEYQKTRETESELPEAVQTFSTPKTTTEIDLAFSDAVNGNSTGQKDFATSTEAVTLSNKLSDTTESETTDESSTSEVYPTSLSEEILDSTRQAETTKRSVVDYTSLQRLLVAKYFGNETNTSSTEDSGENWLNEVQDETTHKTPEDATKSSDLAKSQKTSLKNWIYTTASINSKRTTTDLAGTSGKVEITTPTTVPEKPSRSVESVPEREIDICETGSCKQLASKMLFYMNHSVDPCDDFYEYACGGLEADGQIKEKDLSERVYETIALEAHKKADQPEYTQFGNYYESCLKYEINFDKSHRIKLAKEALSKVGMFYTSSSWPGEFQGFSALFANMLLNNAPLIFDIAPDVNETNPDAFTLKIGPAIDKSPFQFANAYDPCDDEDEQTLHDFVDLKQLYENYKSCKNNTRSLVTSITHALKELGIFQDLKNPYNISQYLDGTIINIDLEIIKGILPTFPPQSEILEAYRSKKYTVTTLGQLEADCKLLNWTQLIFALTGTTLGPNAQIQVYYKNELINAMHRLYRFSKNHEFDLNNALLGLYARNLYQDLVAPRSSRYLEKHCLYMATYFLEKEASRLYLSSFSDKKLQNMKVLMENLFHELKETLKLELERSEWAVEWGREVLLKKLADMRMSLPDLSYFKNSEMNTLKMTDNYFENSLTFMKKYRSMIYSVLQKNPNDPEQIWTFFASPFQSRTRTIYGLNLIVIPFGAIDWPLLSQTGESFVYLLEATVGNLIAREIAHNFDTNGIRYWNGSRDSEFALMTDSDMTKMTFEEYIDCHRSSLYQHPMEMSLPATGQRVSFTIPPLTLNERMSDAVGMRLAHDTLARLNSAASEKRLPWLDLNVSQLFYLAYAQTHCTKAPLTSSFVSLYEDPSLPSRIRVFVAASNNQLLGEAWSCPEGSQILPAPTCGVFPHLEYRSTAPDAA